MKTVRHNYTLHEIRVIDGDTIIAWVDIDELVRVRTRIRIKGLESCEIDEPGGRQAQLMFETLIYAHAQTGWRFVGNIRERDNHGRLVGDVQSGDGKSALAELQNKPYFWTRTRHRES